MIHVAAVLQSVFDAFGDGTAHELVRALHDRGPPVHAVARYRAIIRMLRDKRRSGMEHVGAVLGVVTVVVAFVLGARNGGLGPAAEVAECEA